MRAIVVLVAVSLASCGGQDAKESRIIGRWRTDAMATSSNSVFLNLSHDENAISGHADVNGGVYDLDGTWEGSLEPTETINLEISVVVRGRSITGSGTLKTGDDEQDLTVNGRRTGMAFDMHVIPEAGQDVKVSGQIAYDLKDFKLRVDLENIPTDAPESMPRSLQLTVRGTRRGGGIDLLGSPTRGESSVISH